MRYRTAANCACAAPAGFSFVGGVVAPTLRAFGFKWLSDEMAVIKMAGIEINWDGVYLIILISSLVCIAGINFDLVLQWKRRRDRERHRDWNMSFCAAMEYMAQGSTFRIGIPKDNVKLVAMAALREAAQIGKIRVAGYPLKSLLRKEIPKRVWHQAKVNVDDCASEGTKGAVLLSSDDPKAIVYFGLMVDRREIKNFWPATNSR